MPKPLQAVIPPGITARRIIPNAERVLLLAEPKSATARWPLCGRPSRRIHSTYVRRLADLPWHRQVVEIRPRARRFQCVIATCRRICAERLPAVTAPLARRTSRLTAAQRHVGLALGGEPGSRLAHRLAMPVSGDTLLRLVRAAGPATRARCR